MKLLLLSLPLASAFQVQWQLSQHAHQMPKDEDTAMMSYDAMYRQYAKSKTMDLSNSEVFVEIEPNQEVFSVQREKHLKGSLEDGQVPFVYIDALQAVTEELGGKDTVPDDCFLEQRKRQALGVAEPGQVPFKLTKEQHDKVRQLTAEELRERQKAIPSASADFFLQQRTKEAVGALEKDQVPFVYTEALKSIDEEKTYNSIVVPPEDLFLAQRMKEATGAVEPKQVPFGKTMDPFAQLEAQALNEKDARDELELLLKNEQAAKTSGQFAF